jgi:hypothetical protein
MNTLASQKTTRSALPCNVVARPDLNQGALVTTMPEPPRRYHLERCRRVMADNAAGGQHAAAVSPHDGI